MSEHAVAQQQNTNTSKRLASNAVNFQRKAVNHDELTALPEWKGDTLSGGAFAEPRFAHDFSGVPAFTAMVQQTRPLLRTQLMVQKYPKDGTVDSGSCPTCPEAVSPQVSAPVEPATETAEPASGPTPTVEPTEPTSESAALEETTAPALLVEDSTTELAPGQMRKSDFLAQLRTEVNRAAEAAMTGTGRTTADCPYLNYWFGYYSLQDSAHIERAIHRYAPETANANTASGYIPIIAGRVRRAVETWTKTGEITGVPEGVPTTVPGETPAESGEGATTATGPVMFKAREGDARAADNPQAIQAELGEGRPLDSGVRSRMESAFGMDFAYVRTHTDTTAAGLSNSLNARAFTVGEHVAFGSGEYKPGSLYGDALIAHELAHVVQQSGANTSVAPLQTQNEGHNVFEEDADNSAVGALASLWGGAKGKLADIAQNAMPRLRSGLRLQRCITACDTKHRKIAYNALSEAKKLVKDSITKCQMKPTPQIVKDGLNEFFNGNTSILSKVISGLKATQKDLNNWGGTYEQFECEKSCNKQIAWVRRKWHCTPIIRGAVNVHLCPPFFDSPNMETPQAVSSSKAQAGTIIHEFTHLGACVPDKVYYKSSSWSSKSTEDLLNNADSYSEFVLYTT